MAVQTPSKGLWRELHDVNSWSPTKFFPGFESKGTSLLGSSVGYIGQIFSRANNGRPDLKFLRDELGRQSTADVSGDSRAVVFEFSSNSIANGGRPISLKDSSELHTHLKKECTPINRVYVLEDITTAYIDGFGSHFDLDPSFFARHLRSTFFERSKEATESSPLPSFIASANTYCIWYPELVAFPSQGLKLEDHDTSYFCRSNLYRKINFVRGPRPADPKAMAVGTIMRKLSVVVRIFDDDTIEGLILVDPPVGDNIYGQHGDQNLMTAVKMSDKLPYKGAFIDFATWSNHPSSSTDDDLHGRLSMLDDISYYAKRSEADHKLEASVLGLIASANTVAASRWVNMLEYLNEQIAKLEFVLESARTSNSSGWTSKGHEGLDTIEDSLQEIGHWRRRCTLYHEMMESNVSGLKRFLKVVDNHKLRPAHGLEGQDWDYLAKVLLDWKSRTSDDVQAIFALLSLVEGKKSVDQAENSKLLAMLGVLYLPFSLAAGVLSMSGDVAAGSNHFWTFFAVAVPLLVVSLVLAVLPRLQVNFPDTWRPRKGRNPRRERKRSKTNSANVQGQV